MRDGLGTSRGWRKSGAVVVLGAVAAFMSGCFPVWVDNPSFPHSNTEVETDWIRMKEDPVPLERPVVVLGGYHAVSSWPKRVERRMIPVTSGDPDDFLLVAFPFHSSLGAAADDTVAAIEKRWPSDDPEWTVEVDVIGISMGGLVAREAYLDEPIRGGPRKRLKVNTLYTLATPHQGATAAKYFAFDQAARDMRPDSAYLDELNARLPDAEYEIIAYTQLRDSTVGATRSAPPGEQPIWTGGTFAWSHYTTPTNIRLLADIARRLRGEAPLTEPGDEPPRN